MISGRLRSSICFVGAISILSQLAVKNVKQERFSSSRSRFVVSSLKKQAEAILFSYCNYKVHIEVSGSSPAHKPASKG